MTKHYFYNIYFIILLYISYEILKIYPLINNTNWGVYDWDTSALHFLNGYVLKNDPSSFLIFFKNICSGIYANQFIPNFFFLPGYLSYFFSIDTCFLLTILLIKILSFYGCYKYLILLRLSSSSSIFLSIIWLNVGWISARYAVGHLALFAYLLFPYLSYLFFEKTRLNNLLLCFLLTQITSFGLIYLQIYFLVFLFLNSFLFENNKVIFFKNILRITYIQIPSLLLIMPIIFGILFGINEVRQHNILFFNHYIYNTGYNIFELFLSTNFLNFDDHNIILKFFNSTDEQIGSIGWIERYNYLGPIIIFIIFFNKIFIKNQKKLIILLFISFLLIVNFSFETITLDRNNYASYSKKYSIFQIFNISENTDTWIRMPIRFGMIFNFFLLLIVGRSIDYNFEKLNENKYKIITIILLLIIILVTFISNQKVLEYINNYNNFVFFSSVFLSIYIAIYFYLNNKNKNLLIILFLFSSYLFLVFSSDYYMAKRSSFNNQSLDYIYDSDINKINNLDGYWRLSDTNWIRDTSVCKIPKTIKYKDNFNYKLLYYYNYFLLTMIILIILFLLYEFQLTYRNKKRII